MEAWIASAVASLGGGAIVSGFVIKWFGQKLIENQLERGKEKLKFRIESEFDRISKIHQREFEVLPTLWTFLLDSLGRLAYLTNPIKMVADLERKTPEELEEFLEHGKFKESEKAALRATTEKNQLLQRYNILEAIFEYERTSVEFHNFLLRNKIFLTREIFESFDKIDTLMMHAEAICEEAVADGETVHGMLNTAREILKDKIDPLKEIIADQIQQRLHFHEAK